MGLHLMPKGLFNLLLELECIGKDGKLTWRLPSDLKYFKSITLSTIDPGKKNAVITGRKAWESIPAEHRPLPGRLNVRMSLNMEPCVLPCIYCLNCLSIEKVFFIGGGQREALNAPGCDAIHIAEIESPVEFDAFLPMVDTPVFQHGTRPFPSLKTTSSKYLSLCRMFCSGFLPHKHYTIFNGKTDSFKFERHEEYLYLRFVEEEPLAGTPKDDRAETGITLFILSLQMRFNQRKTFPLLTTKKVCWHGVVEELLWFISGSANAKILQGKGIHIRDINGLGLKDQEEGDLGPAYGFQWRHLVLGWNSNVHIGQGFDQLLDVIYKIKNNPHDCLIMLTAWILLILICFASFSQNSLCFLSFLPLVNLILPLPFFVANGKLSSQMYRCSADMGLVVPFSIASYALLTCTIAHVCDLSPGDFVHGIGDAHVYCTHVKPILKINTERKDIGSFLAADFKLIGYDPHDKLKMKMAD
ncbi:hypothetical protein ACJRO7_027727 [Eucalyptus globulus]|uniref:thymidylate synthase n=1 Tax=Eucalyptus globulus TaxID=34317 RepID=A0ABD3JS46_EUCGL